MMSEILSLTFEGYQLVTKWNADMNEEKQRKILRVLALARNITSLNFLAHILLILAVENPFPGRLATIYWICEWAKIQLLEKLTGVSYKDYQNFGYLRCIFTHQGRDCRRVISQIDNMKMVTLEFLYLKLKTHAIDEENGV